MTPTTVWVTPHTHWDREWVMTQGQFQVRLVELIDGLLEIIAARPDYRFFLDGQAIVLEDYLEIRPERATELKAAFACGQLAAGPYYVLADQFLPGAEAAVRNLLLGRTVLRSLEAAPAPVGYAPDAFGMGASFPTILAGFGIPYALFGRGHLGPGGPIQTHEFWWEGPDGARVLAAGPGYAQAVFMSYPDIWRNIFRLVPDPEQTVVAALAHARALQARATTRNLYFPVGIDHMRPSPALPALLDTLNARQDEFVFRFGMTADYLAAVAAELAREPRPVTVYRGELRGDETRPNELNGTLSAQVRLKQANQRCEALLAQQLEPLAVLTEAAGGRRYPAGHLRKLWRLLVQNHPHDSICGCSIDQVHADMMNRYEQIEATGEYLLKDWLHSLLERIQTRGPAPEDVALVVVNPLGQAQTGLVRALVRVERRLAAEECHLVDGDGRVVAARVRRVALKQQDLESVYMTNRMLATVLSKTPGADRPDDEVYTVLAVDFVAAEVPALGWRTWWLRSGPAPVAVSPGVRLIGERAMENDFLRVTVNGDGTFDLLDRRTGRLYAGLGALVDREDIGNAYDYCGWAQPDERTTRRAAGGSDQPGLDVTAEVLDHRITLTVRLPWALPAAVEGARRAERLVALPVTMSLTLAAGAARVDLSIELDNTARDHCLRLDLPTGLAAPQVATGDVFNVQSRPASRPGGIWRDEPMQGFVDVSDGREGLCVMTRGLYAYEAVQEAAGTRLGVTLLRAVGQLGPAAGANHPVPSAQVPGPHRFDLALAPHAGDYRASDCVNAAQAFAAPLLAEAALPHGGEWAAATSFLSLAPELGAAPATRPVLTAIKQAEDGRGVIVRLWNPGAAQRVVLRGPLLERRRLEQVNLAEESIGPVTDGQVELPERGVVTLRLV